jgi:NAD(P)-dependent dehydrogenase (short-subunit alcohol dehydrogenase family)
MAVEQPVREWPHYVAAKRAVEAFATVAPLQYPQTSALIVRPEKLLTEMTNTPMGRQKAAPPGQMANEIVERLQKPLRPGSTEILPARSKS